MWYFKVAIFDHKALAISIALGMLRSLPLSLKFITLIEKTTSFQTLINANQFPANRIEFRIGAKVIWTFVKRKNSTNRPAFVYIYLYIRLFYFLFYAILFFRLFWSGASETVKKRLWLLLRWFYGFDLIFVFIAHACVRLSFLFFCILFLHFNCATLTVLPAHKDGSLPTCGWRVARSWEVFPQFRLHFSLAILCSSDTWGIWYFNCLYINDVTCVKELIFYIYLFNKAPNQSYASMTKRGIPNKQSYIPTNIF